MIRLAKEEDIHELMILAKEFCDQGPSMFRWDEERAFTLLENSIKGEDSLVVVIDYDGVLAGTLVAGYTTHPMFGTAFATELMWYVKPENRGGKSSMKLLKTFMDWAKHRQADVAVVADIHAVGDLSRVYTRLGFTKTETTYMMELK